MSEQETDPSWLQSPNRAYPLSDETCINHCGKIRGVAIPKSGLSSFRPHEPKARLYEAGGCNPQIGLILFQTGRLRNLSSRQVMVAIPKSGLSSFRLHNYNS